MNNGTPVVRIGKKGTKSFAFGDGPVISLDVIQIYNEWLMVQEQLIEVKDGQRHIKDAKAYSETQVAFVSMMYATVGGDPVTHAEAAEFIKELTVAQMELQHFFDLTRDARWSSLVSSAASPPGSSTPGPSTSSGPASPEPSPGKFQTEYVTEPAS